MRRLRRATALLMSLLLAQLTLAGTGTQCAVHGSAVGRSEGPAGAAHAAMTMGNVAAGDEAAASAGDCSDCETAADHVPCDLPWAPGAACAQMTSCTALMVVVGVGSAIECSQGSSQVIAAAASVPPGPTSAPEPPPPRA
jgi:hypothetical protein